MLGIVTDYSVFYFTSAREALRDGAADAGGGAPVDRPQHADRVHGRRRRLLRRRVADARDARLLPLLRPRDGDHRRDGPARLGAARAGDAAAAGAGCSSGRACDRDRRRCASGGTKVSHLATRKPVALLLALRRLRRPRRGRVGPPQRAAARAPARRGPAVRQPRRRERPSGGRRASRPASSRPPSCSCRTPGSRVTTARARPAPGGARAAAARRGRRRRRRPADRAAVRRRLRTARRSGPLRGHLRQRPDRGAGDRTPRTAPAGAPALLRASGSAARPSAGAARRRSQSRPCRRPTRRSGG